MTAARVECDAFGCREYIEIESEWDRVHGRDGWTVDDDGYAFCPNHSPSED